MLPLLPSRGSVPVAHRVISSPGNKTSSGTGPIIERHNSLQIEGLGKIRGCDVKVQLYTVPGQVQYSSTRKLVLKEVDGLVFVADSLEVRREKNLLSLKDLHENLKSYGTSIFKVPLVMQYNKRDLEDEGIPLMSIEQMERDLNRQLKAPAFSASAISGKGVAPTITECLKRTLLHLQRELKWAQ